MCGYFCIGFIDFILKDRSLLNSKSFFTPSKYEKNEKTTKKVKTKKIYCVICVKYRKFQNPKI